MAQILQLSVVIGLNAGKKPEDNPVAKVLYCDFDSGAAEDAFRQAGPEFTSVSIYAKGALPRNTRYPAREAIDAKARIEAAKNHTDAAVAKKQAEAKAADAEAEKLTKKAAAIREELANPSASPTSTALQETLLKSAKVISPEATLAHKKSRK